MKNTKLILGLVAVALLASPANASKSFLQRVTKSALKAGKNYKSLYCLPGVMNPQAKQGNDQYLATLQAPMDWYIQPRKLLIAGIVTKAATTWLGSKKNSGKYILKNVGISAAGNLATTTLLLGANVAKAKEHKHGAHALRFFAAVSFVSAQNNWNPFAALKKLWKAPKDTIRKFFSHKYSDEDLVKFVANTLAPLMYAHGNHSALLTNNQDFEEGEGEEEEDLSDDDSSSRQAHWLFPRADKNRNWRNLPVLNGFFGNKQGNGSGQEQRGQSAARPSAPVAYMQYSPQQPAEARVGYLYTPASAPLPAAPRPLPAASNVA